jgi:hypothetical protein
VLRGSRRSRAGHRAAPRGPLRGVAVAAASAVKSRRPLPESMPASVACSRASGVGRVRLSSSRDESHRDGGPQTGAARGAGGELTAMTAESDDRKLPTNVRRLERRGAQRPPLVAESHWARRGAIQLAARRAVAGMTQAGGRVQITATIALKMRRPHEDGCIHARCRHAAAGRAGAAGWACRVFARAPRGGEMADRESSVGVLGTAWTYKMRGFYPQIPFKAPRPELPRPPAWRRRAAP